MKKNLVLFTLLVFFVFSCTLKDEYAEKTITDSNGYTYKTYKNDPTNLRIYTLENGLTVFLSTNKIEPRVQTIISVRVGGVDDPDDNTGLAHYFEHLMFKGTSNIGTTDYEKEKVLLDEIIQLYEQHKSATNADDKKAVYRKIDSISQIASRYAIAGEYDKMISSLGAKGTNAFTSTELTSYINDIPSNELDKWVWIEYERFKNPVIRLFHTELETVYEEYNMGQDNDGRKVYKKLNEMLFPGHPYGMRDVIGEPDHLKNPSINAIYNFYNSFYVPNNMAVILSGDFNPDSMIVKIDETFGQLEPKEVVKPEFAELPPITESQVDEVYGPTTEYVQFAYRLNGIKSKDVVYAEIINQILNNRTAGSLRLNLIQNQKLISAWSYTNFLKYYGAHFFGGVPKGDQTLDEVASLIKGEIEKIKNGEFDEEILRGIIKNLRIERIKKYEQNWRAYFMMNAFIYDRPWKEELEYVDILEKITKDEIIAFANDNYNNDVLIYKRKGEDKNKVVVEKPQITPVELNRDNKSGFFTDLEKKEVPRLKPVFFNYGEDLRIHELTNGLEIDHMNNEKNDLFELYISFPLGSIHSKELPVAIQLLDKLGTSKYSPQEFRLELFKNGLILSKGNGENHSLLMLSGLQESFIKALELASHLLSDIQPDSAIYAEHVNDIMKSREDQKTNKWDILHNALAKYVQYGPVNSQTAQLSEEELRDADPRLFTDLIHRLNGYQHRLFYYGPENEAKIIEAVKTYYTQPDKLSDIPQPEIELQEVNYEKPKVFLVHYDMVQSLMMLKAQADKFDPELFKVSDLFNVYYGQGLTSIVFQEMREKQGLAYMAYGYIQSPLLPEQSNYINAVMSTQPDKMYEALSTFNEILSDMPKSDVQFKASKESLLKEIEAERHQNGNSEFWRYRWLKSLNIDQNNREEVYNHVKTLTLDDMEQFFNEYIKNRTYNYLVVGDKNRIDKQLLARYGEIVELELEDIYGY